MNQFHLRLASCVVILTLLGASRLDAQETRPPNIIYVMLDDAGYGDFGAFGSPVIQTPTFDRMCREGMRFNHHYSGSAVCAPTRCVLMTGLHPGHCRRRDNTATGAKDEFPGRPLVFLEDEDRTIAEFMKEAGYVTGGIGKWGLGNPNTSGEPERQGFDHWYGYLDQVHAHDHYTEWLWKDGQRVEIPENQNNGRKVYAHDLFEKETFEFIKRNRDEPFFLYLAYTLPHGKYEIPHSDPAYELYADLDIPQQSREYAAMVTRADRTVGGVLELLADLSLDENTIVFFTSDNGPNLPFLKTLSSHGGLRGVKRFLFEGGLRAAMAVRWPGHIPAGSESDFVWGMVDMIPTACDLAGSEIPAGLDGISVVPTLLGKEQDVDRALYWEIHHPFQQAVRKGQWKAFRLGTKERLELYDLTKDPGEEVDVRAAHPGVAAEMKRIMDESHVESRFYPAVERARRRGE